jgi:hypothetical protein
MRRILALLLAAQTGCFSYVPAAGEMAQGTPVRTQLNEPIDFRLTNVSVNNTMVVDGEVVSQSADTLFLSAISLQSASGFSAPASGETLRIPVERIESVRRRRFDLLRSAAVIVAAGVTAALAFSTFDSDSGGSGGGGPEPLPQ